ncbi:MAG: LytTR family transcriptional regulator DNA-binding domain-containing protein [Bacteroidota bacterium]
MQQEEKAKLLIVEDDMIIAADISMQLSKLGYEIIGINTRAEDALQTIATNPPDVVLMDIILSGKMNGIEAATQILETHQIPVVFLTSNTDDATFQKALMAKPFAFIAKPFQLSVMQRTLQLTLQRAAMEKENTPEIPEGDHFSTMDDRLFIRHKNQLVKVKLTDILYAEADRNYCKLHTAEKSYLLSIPLRTLEIQLPDDHFLRVHRSFVVNLDRIDAISEYYEFLVVQDQQVPISRRLKDGVVKRLNMI